MFDALKKPLLLPQIWSVQREDLTAMMLVNLTPEFTEK